MVSVHPSGIIRLRPVTTMSPALEPTTAARATAPEALAFKALYEYRSHHRSCPVGPVFAVHYESRNDITVNADAMRYIFSIIGPWVLDRKTQRPTVLLLTAPPSSKIPAPMLQLSDPYNDKLQICSERSPGLP